MYTRFFGLNRLPFESSPDPSFLFDGPVHREAIAAIEYAVATRMGFIMLTGEVGLGKTTVVRAFLDRFDRGRLLPIYVFHPLLSFDDLLELLSDELGLPPDGAMSSFNRLRAIQRELIRLYDEQRQVILVIDEAQRLPEDTLENLRLLTNLETADTKLLQIVLVGQPELEVILAQPHLRQLEQRIVLKARLDNLKPDDALRYLRHRLGLAGAEDPEAVISAPALGAIVELAEGVPRRMNILANRTLIDAFGADEKPVTAARVRRIAGDNVKPAPMVKRQRSPWLSRAALVVGAGVLAFAALAWETHRLPMPFELAWSSPAPQAAVEASKQPVPPPAPPAPQAEAAAPASVDPPAPPAPAPAAPAPAATPTPASTLVVATPIEPAPAPVPVQPPPIRVATAPPRSSRQHRRRFRSRIPLRLSPRPRPARTTRLIRSIRATRFGRSASTPMGRTWRPR